LLLIQVQQNYFKTFKSLESNENKFIVQEEPQQENKEEYKRDQTKWKYNKQELLERKKKLLKDKSLFKK
jgi:hypothetical protein